MFEVLLHLMGVASMLYGICHYKITVTISNSVVIDHFGAAHTNITNDHNNDDNDYDDDDTRSNPVPATECNFTKQIR